MSTLLVAFALYVLAGILLPRFSTIAVKDLPSI